MRSTAKDIVRPVPSDIMARVGAIDWQEAGRDLDAQGCAVLKGLLSTNGMPRDSRRSMPDDSHFRSRVVMARHGFGRGEYQYFAYPLPDVVAQLRPALYPRLRAVANRWNEAMGIDVRYPESHEASSNAAMRPARRGRRRCCCNTAPATTTACTRTSTASTCSRCRWRSCCPRRARDFTGGEFVLTEQRPRMQSRPRWCRSRQGDAVVFAVQSAPGAGHARKLSRQSPPRRQPGPLRPPPYPRHHLPRRAHEYGAHDCRSASNQCRRCSRRSAGDRREGAVVAARFA